MDAKAISKTKPGRISIRIIITVLIFLAAVGLFAIIANEMVLENENNLDKEVFRKLASITNPSTTKWMVFITFFGSSYFLMPAYSLLLAFFFFYKKNRSITMDIAAFSIVSTILLFTLKAIFHRHRPLDPIVKNVNGFSFPSGHSFSSFTFFGLLIYIIWKVEGIHSSVRWLFTILFILLASAVALCRVYLHVHYASDVIAGISLCVIWLLTSFWIFSKLRKTEFT
jgi:undecaprenyl-diphosphatase